MTHPHTDFNTYADLPECLASQVQHTPWWQDFIACALGGSLWQGLRAGREQTKTGPASIIKNLLHQFTTQPATQYIITCTHASRPSHGLTQGP